MPLKRTEVIQEKCQLVLEKMESFRPNKILCSNLRVKISDLISCLLAYGNIHLNSIENNTIKGRHKNVDWVGCVGYVFKSVHKTNWGTI